MLSASAAALAIASTLAVARDGFVLHREIVPVSTAPVLGTVAHMAERGEDFKILAQIFLRVLALAGFDDQEIGCHAQGD
jgi:hypothetical protein